MTARFHHSEAALEMKNVGRGFCDRTQDAARRIVIFWHIREAYADAEVLNINEPSASQPAFCMRL